MSLEGQQIGRYHLVELLSSGGMGEVYLATDVPVNRQQIASISDPILTQGEIGLLVGNKDNSAEAFFFNAKVWTL